MSRDATPPEALGVAETIKNLKDVELFLRENAEAVLRQAVAVYPRVLSLVEAAGAHLDELHGPPVDQYRCDHCGNTLPADFSERGSMGTELLGWLRVSVLVNEERATPVCENHEAHDGDSYTMRLVRCRVTADVVPGDES